MEGYRADEVDGEIRTIVSEHVAHKKVVETILYKAIYSRNVHMLQNERGESGQEAIGERLSIDTLDNIGRRQAILLQESFAQPLRHLPLEKAADEQPSQYGSAPFISEDIAQWGNVGFDLPTIEQTGIGARTQYAGYPLGIATESTGCTEHIAGDFDAVAVGQHTVQGFI